MMAFRPLQNLGLAVRGFRAMLTDHSSEPGVSESALVLAGGYDKRLAENREYYEELVDLVAEYGLKNKVSSSRKGLILGSSTRNSVMRMHLYKIMACMSLAIHACRAPFPS